MRISTQGIFFFSRVQYHALLRFIMLILDESDQNW